jgi:hypothetical protein
MRDSGVTKYRFAGPPTLLFSPRMQGNPRPPFQPAEAGAVLAGTVGVCGGAGALVGWAAGNVGYGALAGVVVGLPAGVFAVYRRFKGYFS